MTVLVWMLAWLMIFIFASIAYPERIHKGYMSRLIIWIGVNVFRGSRNMLTSLRWQDMLVYLLAFCVVMWPAGLIVDIVGLFAGFDIAGSGAGIWIAMIVRVIDDVVNGEDDAWKKRWEAVKNKIKWLWTPAMEPKLAPE